jgi:hypothetical protein
VVDKQLTMAAAAAAMVMVVVMMMMCECARPPAYMRGRLQARTGGKASKLD